MVLWLNLLKALSDSHRPLPPAWYVAIWKPKGLRENSWYTFHDLEPVQVDRLKNPISHSHLFMLRSLQNFVSLRAARHVTRNLGQKIPRPATCNARQILLISMETWNWKWTLSCEYLRSSVEGELEVVLSIFRWQRVVVKLVRVEFVYQSTEC